MLLATKELLAGILAMAVVCCAACDPVSSPPPDAAVAVGPLPRYWLQDTELRSKPDGGTVRKIDGPVLVELLPDGKVRSLQ